MFNVSFNVSDEKLTTALTALKDSGASSIQVAAMDDSAIVNAEAALNVPPKRKYKKRKKVEPLGLNFGTQRDRAALLLAQIGVQPFALKDFKKKARRLGIQDTAIHEVLRREIASGHFKHVDRGLYQRTGAGFANSLGINAEAVNQ